MVSPLFLCSDMCDPGHHYDDTLETCEPCVLGTYQPDGGRTTCIACPPGKTTLQKGTTDSLQCVGKARFFVLSPITKDLVPLANRDGLAPRRP